MTKEKLKININGKSCTIRFNAEKLRFEHNFGCKDNNGIRQSRIISGTSIDDLTKNIQDFYEKIKNKNIHSDQILFKNYIDFYLNNVAIIKNCQTTVYIMKSTLKRLPLSVLNTPLNRLTTKQMQIAYSQLRERYTINSVMAVNQAVNTALNYAVKIKLIPKNVNADCIVHNYVNGKKVFIDIKETIDILQKLKSSEKYKQLYRPTLFLAVTGVRCGECLGLRKSCVDTKTNIVKINAQITNFDGFKKELKTRKSNRTLQLSKEVINLITQYEDDSEFVFTTSSGKPWGYVNFHFQFRKAMSECGYPDITPKQFRNSFVKNAINKNISLKIIQNILGHSKLSTTMDIYGELTDSDTYNATITMCSSLINNE